MKHVAKDAVIIASYFNNVKHAYWISKFRDEQMNLYRNTYSIVSPNDTRWNSNYNCYVSLLRSKGALKVNFAFSFHLILRRKWHNNLILILFIIKLLNSFLKKTFFFKT